MPSIDEHFRALTRVRPSGEWPELGEGAPEPSAPGATQEPIASASGTIGGGGTVGSGPTQPTETTDPPRASSPPPPHGGMFGAMLDAIEDSGPPEWRFMLERDRLDGDWRLDGDVDDGAGPGRLLVDLTERPGMLLADPCADSEFRAGGGASSGRCPTAICWCCATWWTWTAWRPSWCCSSTRIAPGSPPRRATSPSGRGRGHPNGRRGVPHAARDAGPPPLHGPRAGPPGSGDRRPDERVPGDRVRIAP